VSLPSELLYEFSETDVYASGSYHTWAYRASYLPVFHSFHVMCPILLKLQKSKEETYDAFQTFLRDSLPKAPPLTQSASQLEEIYSKSCVLRDNDLRMDILLLHECRPVLQRARKHFPVHVKSKCIRSISNKLLVKMVGNQKSQINQTHPSRGRRLTAISYHS
jgi:hypothetical protein